MRLVDTRNPGRTASFREAVLASVAPSGGLWVPEPVAAFGDWPELLALGWVERSRALLGRLVGDEIAAAPLAVAVREAFDFPLPLAEIAPSAAPRNAPDGSRLFALELFHGPTLAFKDFGARFFAAVLDLLREPGRPVTILTATSGDTGAAVAHAFWRDGVRVVVLYPRGRVSPLQELQLGTLGGNVTALAVDGSFDDCQALVKAVFADAGLAARHGLTSANSINVARLLPQVLYYAEAVAQLRRRGIASAPVVAVPSGNFGNLYAGLLARAMGLPLGALVAATNANSTVPDYLASGDYRPRPSVATLSNAMDVGAPNNWERIEHLVSGEPGGGGQPVLAALRRALRWGWQSDDETRSRIRELLAAGYLADPHAAVAYGVLRDRLAAGETGLFLGTAHPAKFLPLFEAMGIEVAVPEPLARLRGEPLLARPMANDLAALTAALDAA